MGGMQRFFRQVDWPNYLAKLQEEPRGSLIWFDLPGVSDYEERWYPILGSCDVWPFTLPRSPGGGFKRQNEGSKKWAALPNSFKTMRLNGSTTYCRLCFSWCICFIWFIFFSVRCGLFCVRSSLARILRARCWTAPWAPWRRLWKNFWSCRSSTRRVTASCPKSWGMA